MVASEPSNDSASAHISTNASSEQRAVGAVGALQGQPPPPFEAGDSEEWPASRGKVQPAPQLVMVMAPGARSFLETFNANLGDGHHPGLMAVEEEAPQQQRKAAAPRKQAAAAAPAPTSTPTKAELLADAFASDRFVTKVGRNKFVLASEPEEVAEPSAVGGAAGQQA